VKASEKVEIVGLAEEARAAGFHSSRLDRLERIALAGSEDRPRQKIASRPKPKQDPPELREAKKAVRARSRGVCEAATPFCTGSAQHFHHRKPRSAGGSHSEVNGLDVCLTCHRYLHDHPASSYERGLLLHSWENEGREVTG
jgi:hypothetical protein